MAPRASYAESLCCNRDNVPNFCCRNDIIIRAPEPLGPNEHLNPGHHWLALKPAHPRMRVKHIDPHIAS